MSLEVREVLKRLGIPFDAKSFRAHITLARDWKGPEPESLPQLPRMTGLQPGVLQARLFESYRNERGAVCYRPIAAQ